jgi:hypothetical protein
VITALVLSQECSIGYSTDSGEPIHRAPELAAELVWVYQLLWKMRVYITANSKLGVS